MIKPKSICILGKNFKISYHKKAKNVSPHIDGAEWPAFGMCNKYKHEIRILDCGDEAEMLDTMIHEILHLIYDDMGVNSSEKSKHDEMTTVSAILSDTLLRNGFIK